MDLENAFALCGDKVGLQSFGVVTGTAKQNEKKSHYIILFDHNQKPYKKFNFFK